MSSDALRERSRLRSSGVNHSTVSMKDGVTVRLLGGDRFDIDFIFLAFDPGCPAVPAAGTLRTTTRAGLPRALFRGIAETSEIAILFGGCGAGALPGTRMFDGVSPLSRLK
jgi:hypothetical protein